MSICDPWRGFVREALDAQRRYRKAVSAANPGPLRDRLVEIGERIDEGVQECWRVARRGDALVDAIGNLDPAGARATSTRRSRPRSSTPATTHKATVEALQSQADSADRLISVAIGGPGQAAPARRPSRRGRGPGRRALDPGRGRRGAGWARRRHRVRRERPRDPPGLPRRSREGPAGRRRHLPGRRRHRPGSGGRWPIGSPDSDRPGAGTRPGALT